MSKNLDHLYYDDFTNVKNGADYRARAREVLKPCYWYAFLAAFVTILLGGLASGLFSVNLKNAVLEGFSINFDPRSVNNVVEIEQLLEWIRNLDFAAIFAAVPSLPVFLGSAAIAYAVSILFSVFVSSPVKLGYQRYCLHVLDGKGTDLSVLFQYFKRGYYGKSVVLNLLHSLICFACQIPAFCAYAVTILALLNEFAARGTEQESSAGLLRAFIAMICVALIVLCGLLVMWVYYRLYFCYMIMAEHPEIGPVDALRQSAKLMKGNKWRLFCLDLSFIGWVLLAACTCGIGMFFLIPYTQTAAAVFYDDITNRTATKETELPEQC